MLKKLIPLLYVLTTMLYSDTASFTLENDFFGSKEDNHYTNGAFLIWMRDSEEESIFNNVLSDLQTNTAISLTHQMFTPTDKEATEPQWNDLPYAGYAKMNFLLYKSKENYFHEFGINIGAVGPMTKAEEIQDFFHKVVGDGRFKGWDNQLGDQLMAGVSYQFAYKTDTLDWRGFKFDSISNIRAEAGNFYTGGLVSTTVRISSFAQRSFITAGSFMVTDESDLLHIDKVQGFQWDLSAGIFVNGMYNYYIIDEGIDTGYTIEPMKSTIGWQFALNLMYDNFHYTYKLKSSHVNDQRHKRWGGMTVSWRF